VFVFVSVECPVSNRYAPEVKRLREQFAAHGADLVLIYPNPADAPDKIREHLKAFSYPMRALRDPQHELAKVTGVKVTPEAAVFNARGALTYRGRIDDRYVSIGVERPAATRHDLAEAIAATLAGQPVATPRTDAVGCFIADFVP
jgi:DNA-binding transcriptional LysR family regulator